MIQRQVYKIINRKADLSCEYRTGKKLEAASVFIRHGRVGSMSHTVTSCPELCPLAACKQAFINENHTSKIIQKAVYIK